MFFGFDITSVLVWPDIITVLIAPFICFFVALGMTVNRLNIFKPAVNWGIAFVIAAVSTPVIINFSFVIGRASIFFVGPLKSWTIKGAVLGVGLLGAYHIIFYFVGSLLGF